MDVPGLCAECGKPTLGAGCRVCGRLVCGDCLESRHACTVRGPPARGRLGPHRWS